MIKHFILLAIRSFRRSKSDFLINVVGLTAGLTGFILIYLWVNDEVRFDQFHRHGARLFQVMEHQQQQGDWRTHSNSEGYLGSTLMSELPEIENAIAVTPDNFFPQFTLLNGSTILKGTGRFADRAFFDMFSFDLISGDPSSVLQDKVSVAISESLSRRLFGAEVNVLGKTISWDVLNIKKDVTVTGVFRDVPANSSIQFDFVLPFDSFREIMGMNGSSINWDNPAPFETYVLLRGHADVGTTNGKINAFLASKASNSAERKLFLKPYAEKHLHGKYQNGALSGGRIQYVIILSIIGGLILLIACINFVNLYTAKALARIKQIGIKKAIGAQRSTLMAQYISESTLVVLLAMVAAVALAALILPYFNTLTGKVLDMTFDLRMVGALFATTIITSALSGAYPAFYLSGFNAVRTMKGEVSASSGHIRLRKGLSVFQFALSVIFIAGVIISNEQLKFIQREDLGYTRANVVYFPAEGKVSQDVQNFLSQVNNLPGISNASSMLGNIISPGDGEGWPLKVGERTVMVHNVAVNHGWVELVGLDVLEGRAFSADRSSDLDKIICNEEAVKAMELIDPIGKTIGGKEIIGVVRDFHFQSLHQQIKPLVIRLEPQAVTTVLARITKGQEESTLRELERVYKSFNPGFVFDFHFLDENFESMYIAEKRVKAIAQAAALLAVIITCLGLYGLSSYLIERRSKEVSVRKILGSGVWNILVLLSIDYFKLITMAIFIAVPVSVYVARYWLSGFAYRIELSIWYFIAAPVAIVFIAVIALATQTVKAAFVNPLSRLRSE